MKPGEHIRYYVSKKKCSSNELIPYLKTIISDFFLLSGGAIPMNAKMISATLLFLLACVMEILAVLEYFSFPKVLPLRMGLTFALIGAILFVWSVWLYRSATKSR